MDKTPQEELKLLSQAFAKLNDSFKTLLAAKPVPKDTEIDPKAEMNYLHDRINNLHNHMGSSMENLHQRIDKLHQLHYEHANSAKHLPPLTPSQLNKLIKHAGAEGDVQILPKQIYSSQDYIIAEYIKTPKV